VNIINMTSTTRRPVHLNLLKIKLPIGGIMSIIHRATGVFMFLALPYLIYLLDLSLSGPAGYDQANEALHGLVGTIFVFLIMWSLAHHLLAGIRYLLIDADLGVEKELARQTALGVVVAGPILGLLLAGGVL
jgi:succinate dehydrogenase / fumarate reductase cytochrome b subunit